MSLLITAALVVTSDDQRRISTHAAGSRSPALRQAQGEVNIRNSLKIRHRERSVAIHRSA
jgi:hypothetical protein